MKWVSRILYGLLGVVGIGIGLMKIFGSPGLPDCDDRKTFDTVREAVAKMVTPAAAKGATVAEMQGKVTLDDETEVSYDKTAGVRECTGTVSLAMNGTTLVDKMKIAYTISWVDKKEGRFQSLVRPIR
ncbi:hypothetical protein sos41_05130 [Alphaproteobacteria bacterium SO-S41]|nr:hypothetical protein sos41_05130 [Alphaproteobacteria bacterium SO-S41]